MENIPYRFSNQTATVCLLGPVSCFEETGIEAKNKRLQFSFDWSYHRAEICFGPSLSPISEWRDITAKRIKWL